MNKMSNIKDKIKNKLDEAKSEYKPSQSEYDDEARRDNESDKGRWSKYKKITSKPKTLKEDSKDPHILNIEAANLKNKIKDKDPKGNLTTSDRPVKKKLTEQIKSYISEKEKADKSKNSPSAKDEKWKMENLIELYENLSNEIFYEDFNKDTLNEKLENLLEYSYSIPDDPEWNADKEEPRKTYRDKNNISRHTGSNKFASDKEHSKNTSRYSYKEKRMVSEELNNLFENLINEFSDAEVKEKIKEYKETWVKKGKNLENAFPDKDKQNEKDK